MNDETFETIERDGYRIDLWYDLYPPDPRDFDNLGTMLCAHGRYDLGDVQGTEDDVPDDALAVLPLYLFDHSGLRLSTDASRFRAFDRDGWDWGQLGVIYTTVERIRELCGDEAQYQDPAWVAERLRAEVAEYDAFVSGQGCGFTVAAPDGEVLDACGGYLSADDARAEAMSSATWYAARALKLATREAVGL